MVSNYSPESEVDPGYNVFLDERPPLDYEAPKVIQEEDQLHDQGHVYLPNHPNDHGLDVILKQHGDTPDSSIPTEDYRKVGLDPGGQNPVEEGRIRLGKEIDKKRDDNEGDWYNPKGLKVIPGQNDQTINDQYPGSINNPRKWLLRVHNETDAPIEFAQAGPYNKDTSPSGKPVEDLYVDENGLQRSRKNDATLEQFDKFSSQFAKGLTSADVELIHKYQNGGASQWTDEDQKRLQPILDAVEGQVKHLPSSSSRFQGGQEYIDFHNWDGLLLDKITKQYKALNPGRRSDIEDGTPKFVANKAGQGSDLDGPYMPDSGWSTLPPEVQKQLEGKDGAARIFGDDYHSPADLNRLLDEHGAIEVDPRTNNPALDEFLQNPPPGVKRYNYKDDPERTIFFTKPAALVGEADLPANAQLAREDMPKTTWTAFQDAMTNPDTPVPTSSSMAKEAYNKAVDWLENHFKTPGQDMQNWSTKEKIGYILSTGLSVLGPGRGSPGFKSGRPAVSGKSGIRDISDIHQSGEGAGANENIPRGEEWRVDASKKVPDSFLENATTKEFAEVVVARNLDIKERLSALSDKDFADFKAYLESKKPGGKGATAGDFIDWVEKGLTTDKPATAYDKAAEAQAKRKAFKVIENPPQEQQGRPTPSLERETQAAQRAANDKNYQMGKDTAKVNVGQGKGVLNENMEIVGAMVAKGMTPSQIAKRFDITPAAVHQWIKRKGGINGIEDILKKRYTEE